MFPSNDGRPSAANSVTLHPLSVLLLSQSLSGPFFWIPSPSLSKQCHTQSGYICCFDADAFLKRRTPCSHLHALRAALGTRKCKHPSPDFFGSQFIIARMRSSYVFPDNVSLFCHWGSKTICLFPPNLATQGNITRNNVSATKLPSLARP